MRWIRSAHQWMLSPVFTDRGFNHERPLIIAEWYIPGIPCGVGLEDFNMDNINKLYPDLVSHGVTVEIPYLFRVPHGQAGRKLLDGYVKVS